MEKELISIIIPVYNAEKYIEECIKSVLNQTYKNYEIIIIDDGSTDSSFDLCKQFERDNIKLFHTDNYGTCHARNYGIEKAIGEYISFLDADDLLTEDALQTLIDTQKKYDADIVSFGQIWFPGGEITPQDDNIEVLEGLDALNKSLEDNPNCWSTCAKLFKKEVIKDIRFEVGRKVNEDSYFLFECFLNKPKMVISNKIIYKYRIYSESSSHAKFNQKHYDILYFAEKKMNIVKEKYPELKDKAYNVWVRANIALLMVLCNSGLNEYKEEKKRCINEVIKYQKYYIVSRKDNKIFFELIRHRLYWILQVLWKVKYR